MLAQINFNLKNFSRSFSILLASLLLLSTSDSFPIYAQQAYNNPREANGRIVCANCHLAKKETEIKAPHTVFANQVFAAKVEIPYPDGTQQLLANGKRGDMNVGAIVILPEGFKLAPKDKLSDKLKSETKGVYISQYSSKVDNILVVGPIPGKNHREIIFPVLSPDPATNKNVHFYKYPIYVGANRGRGQVYPSGERSNNGLYAAPATGTIRSIAAEEKGGYNVEISLADGKAVQQKIPAGLDIIVKEGESIKKDQPLTLDPNVGGFGQSETEFVLQNPSRIYGYMALVFVTIIGQTFLVLKKKQFEKVQLYTFDF